MAHSITDKLLTFLTVIRTRIQIFFKSANKYDAFRLEFLSVWLKTLLLMSNIRGIFEGDGLFRATFEPLRMHSVITTLLWRGNIVLPNAAEAEASASFESSFLEAHG